MARLRAGLLLVSLVLHLLALWGLAALRWTAPAPPERIAIAVIRAHPEPPRAPLPATPKPAEARSAPPPQSRPSPFVASPEADTPGQGAWGAPGFRLYGLFDDLVRCKRADLLFEVSAEEYEACEAERLFARREAAAPLPLPLSGERAFAAQKRRPQPQPPNQCREANLALDCLD